MIPLDDAWVRECIAQSPGEAIDTQLLRLVRQQAPLATDDAVRGEVERLRSTLEGVGPLLELLADPDVSDVLINGPGPAWVERSGRLVPTSVSLTSTDIDRLLQGVFHRTGRSLDRSHPIGDARLRDGTRISAVLSPLAVHGPVVALRRRVERAITLESFSVATITTAVEELVAARRNVLVFGATGAGKTTLLAEMASLIPHSERVFTIEDAAELCIDHPHVVALECRPANSEGRGAVTLRDLVAASLRLRPDRIVLGEVRGAEALDVVWALASGHRGSLATCHAASAAGALQRLETFVAMGDAGLPHHVIRAQVRSAFDFLIGVERHGENRRISSLHRVVDDHSDAAGVEAIWQVDR